MKSKIIFFTLLLFSICAITSVAQIQQPIRVEYDEDDVEDFDVFSFETKKVALVRYENKKVHNKKEKVFVFDSFDESFTKIATKSLGVSGKWDYTSNFNNEEFQFMLSYNRRKGDFLLIKIDPQTLEFSTLKGVFGKNFFVNDWYVHGKYLFVAGTVKNVCHVVTVDITNGQVKNLILKSMTKHKLTFSDLERIKTPTGYEMGFQYQVRIKKKHHENYLLRFNENGEKTGDFLVLPKPDEKTDLLNATFTKVSNGNYIVTGTYSRGRAGFANGIYIACLSESGLQFIKYHNFLDLHNFTNYMSERTQQVIEKRQDKKEAQGKELNIEYQTITHDISELNGNYIYLGEFYYPTYHTETYTDYITTTGANGQIMTRTVTRTKRVFDGYQYSHAAIAAFNAQGDIQWSNAFDMYVENKPMRPKQFIYVGSDGVKIRLLYVTGSTIKAVSYDNSGLETMKREVEMSTKLNNDKIRYTIDGNCEYWFGNTFLSTGFQRIKNTEEVGRNKKRSVYFINKISF
jgi:hypothetical protein